jgi:uncharacterized membrane protein (GlpM family)
LLNIVMEFLLKAIIGGLVIAGVVTMAERGNPTVGALILGIPLASIVSLIFMHYSGVSPDVFSQLARETVYFVFVSLLFFPIFAYMVLHYGFWLSLSIALTVTFIALYSLLKAL